MSESYDFFLKIVNAGEVHRFESDEPGVARLKVETELEAEEYLYLRKGEDFGGFVTELIQAASLGINQLTMLIEAYAPLAPDLLNISIKETIESFDDFLELYLIITGINTKWKELSKKQFRSFSDFFPFKSRSRKPEVKILCNPDERNEGARIGWEANKHEVRHYIDPKKAGSHRLYLTEKRYVLFYRSPNNNFFGIIGRDEKTIVRLKELFKEEWKSAKMPKPILY